MNSGPPDYRRRFCSKPQPVIRQIAVPDVPQTRDTNAISEYGASGMGTIAGSAAGSAAASADLVVAAVGGVAGVLAAIVLAS